MSWGSSSRLKRRSQAPMGVRRGSSEVAKTGPVSRSAPSTMVRNLKIWKVFPSRVMRSWRRKIGPSPEQADEEGDDGNDRDHGEAHEEHRGRGHVHEPLHHGVPALERDLVEADDGNAVEVLGDRLDRRVLDHVGDDLDVHALVAERRARGARSGRGPPGGVRRRAGRPRCASRASRARSRVPITGRPAWPRASSLSPRKPTTRKPSSRWARRASATVRARSPVPATTTRVTL